MGSTGRVRGHEEGMEAVDLGGGLRTWHGRGTGRIEVLKPNCCTL